MPKNIKGGFLGIPSMGIKDKMTEMKNKAFAPKKPETHYSLVHIEQPSVAAAVPTVIDQKMIDDNRKKCLDVANEKIRLANEDKKQCELKNPRKKIFGIFGGKRKGKTPRSHKKRKHARSTRKGNQGSP
jgi:hypothetical protein